MQNANCPSVVWAFKQWFNRCLCLRDYYIYLVILPNMIGDTENTHRTNLSHRCDYDKHLNILHNYILSAIIILTEYKALASPIIT